MFLSAFEKSVAGAPQDQMLYFFDAEDLSALQKTGHLRYADMWFTDHRVLEATKGPDPALNKIGNHGGIAFYRDSIYSERYFYQHIPNYGSGKVDPATVIGKQPRFDWDSTSKTYLYSETGTQEKLISQLGSGTVHLYRGTDTTEAAMAHLLQRLKSGDISSDEMPALKALIKQLTTQSKYSESLRATLNRLLTDISAPKPTNGLSQWADRVFDEYYDSLQTSHGSIVFLTPDQSKAASWANRPSGQVIQFDVQSDQLMELSKEQQIYAGIEYSYAEIGLVSKEALKSYLFSAK